MESQPHLSGSCEGTPTDSPPVNENLEVIGTPPFLDLVLLEAYNRETICSLK